MTDELRAGAGVSERAHHAGADAPAARRMSAKRKQEAVLRLLRLLRGEDLELVSRDLGVTAADLSTWRDDFLAAVEASLKSRPEDHRDRDLRAMREKIGDLTMANELLEAKTCPGPDPGSTGWRAASLSRGGGPRFVRRDEPDGLALRQARLWSGAGLPGMAAQPGHGLPPAQGRQSAGESAPASAPARAGC